MSKHTIKYYPVDNGDNSLIILSDKKCENLQENHFKYMVWEVRDISPSVDNDE